MFPNSFHTERLVLRPIEIADIASIFYGWAQDAAVTHFLVWRPHTSPADTATYVNSRVNAPPHLTRTFILAGRHDQSVRGAFELRHNGPHRLEFGYVLAHSFWGQGLMTEALCTVTDWAMRQSNLFRISSVCDVENLASARVMEKAGLTREGVLRRWSVHPNISDEPRDCFSYSRIR
jgi:RimJ/RimL family protein N-acetyltransferase